MGQIRLSSISSWVAAEKGSRSVFFPVQEHVDQAVVFFQFDGQLVSVHREPFLVQEVVFDVVVGIGLGARGEQPVDFSALAEGFEGQLFIALAPDAVPVVPGQYGPGVGLVGAVGGESEDAEGARGGDVSVPELLGGFADKPHDRIQSFSLHRLSVLGGYTAAHPCCSN